MERITDLNLGPATIESAASGDRAAFGQVVVLHHDDMVRVAYLVSGDSDIAHDAVQSAWAIAWRKLDRLRDPDALRPWLVSIAANEARQILRRRRRHEIREIELVDGLDGAPAGTSASRREEDLDLHDALSRLKPEDRAIVAMRYAIGLTSDEIGLAVGLTGAGVRARLARAIARLREDLRDD